MRRIAHDPQHNDEHRSAHGDVHDDDDHHNALHAAGRYRHNANREHASNSRAGHEQTDRAADRCAHCTSRRLRPHCLPVPQRLPGYDVGYVARPIHQDPSGRSVSIAATYVVRVRMEHASDADLSRPSAPATYTGPKRIRPGMPEVVELARTGSFEGVLTWVAGLQDRIDFRVTTLTAPPRLIVDFRNH